jgi:stalled ribosome rescue protein Dom34
LGIDIHINDEVGLENKKEVAKFIEIVEDVGYEEFLIIAVDTSGVALARIGNNINMLEEVYLPSSKFYEARIESMSETLDRIFSIIKEIKEREETKVVAAVNTSTKKMIRKYRKLIDLVIEGDFTGTMTGILQVLRSKKIRELNVKNEVLKNIETYEKLLKNMFSDRIIYGMDNIKMAIENKGITNLYVNYQLLLEKPEIIEYIIIALEKRISVTIADRKDFLGMAVSKFGDIVGIY